jgi:hypothetical protein
VNAENYSDFAVQMKASEQEFLRTMTTT